MTKRHKNQKEIKVKYSLTFNHTGQKLTIQLDRKMFPTLPNSGLHHLVAQNSVKTTFPPSPILVKYRTHKSTFQPINTRKTCLRPDKSTSSGYNKPRLSTISSKSPGIPILHRYTQKWPKRNSTPRSETWTTSQRYALVQSVPRVTDKDSHQKSALMPTITDFSKITARFYNSKVTAFWLDESIYLTTSTDLFPSLQHHRKSPVYVTSYTIISANLTTTRLRVALNTHQSNPIPPILMNPKITKNLTTLILTTLILKMNKLTNLIGGSITSEQ